MAQKAKSASASERREVFVIPKIAIETIVIKLVGDSPLICNRWSEKAKKQILDKQMGKASGGRQKKDPKKDYEGTLYKYPGGGYGFPSIAFKAAAVRAAKSVNMPMTDARAAFHVPEELVKIQGKPSMREDMVRVQNGAADIRYRAEFKKWKADVEVRYNTAVISAEQVINLFNIAGFGTGVGEWRSEKNGAYGAFHVA